MGVEAKPRRQDQATSSEIRTVDSIIKDFAKYGDDIALLNFTKDGKSDITYSALKDRIKNLAGLLLKSGLKRGEPVMLLAANSPEWIIAALSLVHAGLVLVPVDHEHNDKSLEHIANDSGAKCAFVDEEAEKRLKKLSNHKLRVIRLDLDLNEQLKPEDEKVSRLAKRVDPQPDDIAIMFYTSGTTAEPKGVPLTHANIMMQIDSAIAKTNLLRKGDRVLLPLPFFHVYPLDLGLLAPLSMGLTIILPRSLTGPEIMRAMNQGKVTVLIGVPRLLRALYTAIESRFHATKFGGKAFDTAVEFSAKLEDCGIKIGRSVFFLIHQKFAPTLRLFTSGGAPLDPDLARKLSALGWDIAVGYGLTETAPLLTMRLPGNRDLESVGNAINGVEIRVSPSDVAPTPEEGEIEAKGPNIFSNYHNLKKKTNETFTDDGWFKTGDLGFLKHGNLHITGRASTTIVLEGGKKIHPDDLEKDLAQKAGVKELGLLQKDNKLVALVVPEGKVDGEEGEEKIYEALKRATAGLPTHLRINDFAITKTALPRTNLGKIKRHDLIELYDQSKASHGKKKRGGSEGVSGADHELLDHPAASQCWQWLEKRFPDADVSMDSSLQIELNVDSLEWMNLTLEIQQELGVELSEDAISRVQIVRDLLNEVVQASESGSAIEGSPLENPEDFIDEKRKQYVQPLNKGQEVLAHSLFNTVYGIMHTFFRIESVGFDKLPKKKQLVFIPNHASYLDAFAVIGVLPYDRLCNTQIAGWQGISFANPFNSFISRLAQTFPIEAKRSLITSLALGAAVLKNGKSMIWFPEGERTLTGDLLKFKPGIGTLLDKYDDVSVVPIYLDGTRHALPPGSPFPRFCKIKVWFGTPATARELEKQGEGRTPAERISNALKDRVQELADKARAEKQKTRG